MSDYGEALEVILVDDGSHDLDPAVVSALGGRLISLRTNQGKGAAVRAGMREARGAVRVYTDVDLPFGSECIRLAEHFIAERGFHVVIGDRTLEASRYLHRVTHVRRLASAVFTTIVGRVVTGGFFDTQCGVKGFRSDVAERLFLLSRIDRFAFDVELVYMSLKHRLDIKRLAVELERNETSSVRVVRDSLRMLVDVARIVVNQYRGRYRDDYLLALITRETRAAQVTIRSRRPS
jgi:dolichyl-phosphate beta-glucosyltransferase